MQTHVDIWSDGSCSHNPGVGGYAALVKANDKLTVVCGSSELTTNNQMELSGFIEGIQYAISNYKHIDSVTVYTDSKYIENAINCRWLYRWHLNGYAKVKNPDLWRTVFELINRISVNVVWVKGHSNNANNALADRFAVAARDEFMACGTVIEL